MKFIDNFQARHGIFDIANLKGTITSPKPENEFKVSLVKVPTYTAVHKFKEKICEGNGWYTKAPDWTTIKTVIDNIYLVIKDDECIGMIILRETLSGKLPLQKLNGYVEVKEFLKTL